MIHRIKNKYLRRAVIIVGAVPMFIVTGLWYFVETLFCEVIPVYVECLVDAWKENDEDS